MLLIRDGWHGFYPLRCAIREELRVRKWQTYVADTNGALVISLSSIGNRQSEMKLYSELTQRKPRSKTDNMTADQIVAYIAGRL